MRPNQKPYTLSESAARLGEILNKSDSSFPERSEIPNRDELTFANGFYVWPAVLMIDIRQSSKIMDAHTRPTIARIYRAYTSEMVAILNGSTICRDISIEGDGVLAVFEGSKKAHIDEVFSVAARANTVLKLINCKLAKKNYQNIRIGIGLAWGRTLMIKAGLKGVGVNEVTWIGGAVNDASYRCDRANRLMTKTMLMNGDFHHNLSDENRQLCSESLDEDTWEADVVNIHLNDNYASYC